MSTETKPRKPFRMLGIVLAILAVLTCTALLLPQPQLHYSFFAADHPVDMVQDAKGTWTYFYVGGDPAELATSARKELLDKGFKEDLANKPWFKFAKGDNEVIICNHNEIAVDGRHGPFDSVVMHENDTWPVGHRPSYIPDQSKTAVVWIHGPKISNMAVATFQVKKLVHGW